MQVRGFVETACWVRSGVLLGALFVLSASIGFAAPSATEMLEAPWSARVAGTQGSGLRVRQGPGLQFPIQVILPDGVRLQVVEGPTTDGDGRAWYQVAGFDRAGVTGWSDSEYLVRMDPTDSDSPVGNAGSGGRTFTARMTAYSYQVAGGGAHGSMTRSGTPVRWGVVAVDPNVIPLGSRLLIEGYDMVFVAEDTGGGIRGNHVDIFFPDYASAVRFGVQQRQVTVLN